MKLTTYFNDFLRNIRLTKSQVDDLITGHTTLRNRLNDDEDLSKIIVSTFLQGSYRRSTAVKPKSGNRSDVDVIVVTKLDKDEYTPDEAMKVFEPFMEKHYAGKYRFQGRSIGIELSYVDLDVVITSAPSEAETGILQTESINTNSSIEEIGELIKSISSSHYTREVNEFLKFVRNESGWRTSPLYIPDRNVEEWKETHPLEQIRWTWNKNASCNGHYINVVKAIKWWKRINDPDTHPKSYPLEHLIGQACPDGISSVAEGVTLTLEAIVKDYSNKPILPDHGVPGHDVFDKITEEEYQAFYEKIVTAAGVAREAYDLDTVRESANKWRELFGTEFPAPPDNSNNSATSGFSQRQEITTPSGGRFA